MATCTLSRFRSFVMDDGRIYYCICSWSFTLFVEKRQVWVRCWGRFVDHSGCLESARTVARQMKISHPRWHFADFTTNSRLLRASYAAS